MTVHPSQGLFDPSVSRHVFLSPHFDDVPFSCGGTVVLLSSHGVRPLMLVVAAQPPGDDDTLSSFAIEIHAWMKLEAASDGVVAARIEEDRKAASLLGLEVQLLPFRDAIYRGDRYLSIEQLFGDVVADDLGLPQEIASAARQAMGETGGPIRWYVPLSIGPHVDHQLVHRAGRLLRSEHDQLWYYADQPYSLNAAMVKTRMDKAGVPTAPVDISVAATWDRRMEAVMAYRSQVGPMFRFFGIEPERESISRAMASCWPDTTAERPVERFWPVAG